MCIFRIFAAEKHVYSALPSRQWDGPVQMLQRALEELRKAAVAAENSAWRQEQDEIDARCAEEGLPLHADVCSGEADHCARAKPASVKLCPLSFLDMIGTL